MESVKGLRGNYEKKSMGGYALAERAQVPGHEACPLALVVDALVLVVTRGRDGGVDGHRGEREEDASHVERWAKHHTPHPE